MKKILASLSFVLFALTISAQVPQGMNYQAVIRDVNGQPKANTSVDIQFSVLKGANLIEEYSESHTALTNNFGLTTVVIGQGTPLFGSFATINWSDDVKFLKVEIDHQVTGITQLLAVPFAMVAARTPLVAGTGIAVNGNEIINTGDVNNTNELQTLGLNGNSLSISNGNSVDLPTVPPYISGAGISINNNVIVANDASPNNELQNLSLSGNQLSITNGNSVILPSAQVYSAGAGLQLNNNEFSANDASATNELQSLNLSGNQLSITNGNSVVLPSAPVYSAGVGLQLNNNEFSANDASATNEFQSLNLSGNQLSITNGNSVVLPSAPVYSAGVGLQLNNDEFTADDPSPTNELQTLALNGDVLSISNGNSITLSSQGASQWINTGNDIYYNNGRVIIGDESPIHYYDGTLLQIISDSYESGLHLYGVNGGSNYNNLTMRDYSSKSGWSWSHKATGGINHQLALDYLDGENNTWNYNCFKIAPNGNSGFGLDYNDTPPSRVSVKGGDVNIIDIGRGIIMKSPDGNCWRVTVNNNGQLIATAISCP